MPPTPTASGHHLIPSNLVATPAVAAVVAAVGIVLILLVCTKKKKEKKEKKERVQPNDTDGDSNSNGKSKNSTAPDELLNAQTAKMIERIKGQLADFDSQLSYVKENGCLPEHLLPDIEKEAVGVVGTLFVVREALLRQLAETEASLEQKGGGHHEQGDEWWAAQTADLKADVAKVDSQLKIATTLFRDKWNFKSPPVPLREDGKKLTSADLKALPIANKPGELTLVGAFGAAALQFEDGVPRGKIEKKLGGQSLAGEIISISTYSHPVGFAVPGYTVAMQESNDRSIFDASATDAIFETPEHDAINAADVFRCKCTCAFCIFDIARSDLGPKLTKQILNDVDAYEEEYANQCDAPGGAEALGRLEAAAKRCERPKDIAALTADEEAPPGTDLTHIVYAQRIAADTSISLYTIVSAVLAGLAGWGHCIPGGVKGLARIVSKTASKYGDFSRCKDLARATIQVKTFEAMATLMDALLARDDIILIRCKNRFDPGWDPLNEGGYRDYQLQVLIKIGGIWRFAECQLNLVKMVQIKNGEGAGGGGHGAFDLARAIDAFSPRTLRYQGTPSPRIYTLMEVGALLHVNLSGNDLSRSTGIAPLLLKALRSPEVRLREFTVNDCEFDNETVVDFSKILATNTTIVSLDFSGIVGPRGKVISQTETTPGGIWDATWEAFADAIARNTTLKSLKMVANLESKNYAGNASPNTLSIAAGLAMARALATNQTLTEVDMSNNRWGDTSVSEALKETICDATHLVLLTLKGCNLRVGGALGKKDSETGEWIIEGKPPTLKVLIDDPLDLSKPPAWLANM